MRKCKTTCANCHKAIAQAELVIESDSRGVPKHTYHRWCVILQSEEAGKKLAGIQKAKLSLKNIKNIFKKEEVKEETKEEIKEDKDEKEPRESVPVEVPIAQ